MNFGLAGRVALVTGASKGLGRAIAQTLAEEGADVVVTARSADLLAELAASIQAKTGRRALAVPSDATIAGEPERVVREALAAFGRLDILVNNVGQSFRRPLEETSDRDWYDYFELNLLAAVRYCRAAIGQMKERRWGRIVNVVGIGPAEPEGGVYASTAAKGGMFAMSKALSIDLAPYGITVNIANPGRIMSDQILRKYSPEERERWATSRIPMGRWGEPEEFAPLVAFLCSEQARYITGTAIAVDGGIRRAAY